MKTLIVANGTVSGREPIGSSTYDKIIAADGGATNCRQLGLIPDLIVGDLDSYDAASHPSFTSVETRHLPSQYKNDLEKALDAALELGTTSAIVIGIGGGRTDHIISNFSVLARYERDLKLCIYDEHAQIFFVHSTWEYSGREGQLVSLLPIGTVNGITTSGLGYPLDNESLSFGEREGLSNYFSDAQVTITIRSGLLVVYLLY